MDARNYANPLLKRYPSNNSIDFSPRGRKRFKSADGSVHNEGTYSTAWRFESERKSSSAAMLVLDYSDPFSYANLFRELDSGKYGSVTKDIQELLMRRREVLGSFYARNPKLPYACLDVQAKVAPQTTELTSTNIIELDDEDDESSAACSKIVPAAKQSHSSGPVVIIDSDDENEIKSENSVRSFLQVNLPKPSDNLLMKDFLNWNFAQNQSSREGKVHIASRTELKEEVLKEEISKDNGVDADTEDDLPAEESDDISDSNSDGLGDIWSEMTVALECSKEATADDAFDEYDAEMDEDCEHSFILKDDIGDVCRICGVIKRRIETIIDYNFSKATRSTTRTYRYEGRTTKDQDQTEINIDGIKSSGGDFTASDIYPHPRHSKMMKPHQIEGFNFLLSNLVTDNPGGCIMAHAPGSGKTFMIISFLQSFMAKYPAARPLVVLPRGILAIWKKEFLRWQVEEIPLFDFYSVKAESRSQQLEVLKQWEKTRSILFLGYKQFSSIICDADDGPVPVACQNYLLKIPTILILDEGHTPRNQDTDVLTSLERIETTRKVVLSGTLYQNHVKEVFTILNLVRPRFLKLENPKAIRKRILSRVEISGRKNVKKENDFYELIEQSLTHDQNQTRKATVIQDLREMTKHVLHYYRGDNLDELPGLVDFAILLRLNPKQKSELKELKSLRKFTISAQGSAIYVHPKLKDLAKNSGVKDRVDEEKINAILEKFDVREGVKANFYLNLLQLCESTGEKLLVFSQYLLPLKFLERMTAKVKGYSIGREMFMITGDSDAETREASMDRFNSTPDARVFFGSIRACGEGISLVGASRIIILDVPLNPSVTRQAIGRAFRPGQVRKVYTYRLIAAGSPEEEDHATCFRKEAIAKMWFEWDGVSRYQSHDMEKLDVNNCGDLFLETPRLNEDIIAIHKR